MSHKPDVTELMIIHLPNFLVSQAPAAFGLVSFLMHAGLEKKYIQGHLLAFSAAAPIVAISTYFILHAVRWHTLSMQLSAPKQDPLHCSD